jgi:hypothetical protein
MALTPMGPVIAGSFIKGVNYNGTSLMAMPVPPNVTGYNISYFLIQLNGSNGNLVWSSHSTTTNESSLHSIKTGPDGNIYAVGDFRGGTFKAGNESFPQQSNNIHNDGIILCFDNNGSIIKAHRLLEEGWNMKVNISDFDFYQGNDIIITGISSTGNNYPNKLRFGSTLLEHNDDTYDFYNFHARLGKHLQITGIKGGEELQPNDVVNIGWEANGMDSVKLEYTTDNWRTTSHTIGTYAVAEGGNGINFTVPVMSSSQVFFRVSDPKDPYKTSTHLRPVRVVLLELTNPKGGEQLLGRDPLKLYWNSHSSITNVRIEFTTDGWVTKTLMGVFPASNGKEGVITTFVPNVSSTKYHIRISDAANPIISSENTVPMTITPFVITVTSPNGGEMLLGGTQHTIKWNSNNNNQVYRADYSTDNGTTWQPIFANSQNTATSYLWTVPSDVLSRNCKVRITTFYGSGVQDVSDANFSILPLVFTKRPDAGQELAKGTPYEIQWIGSPGVTGVQLFYSSDNGANWQMLADNLPSSGTYIWNVPNIMNATSRLRIQAKNNLSWQADSDIFNIGPAFYITYPSGGESFNSSTTQTIRWKANSNNMVNISYLHPNGQYIRINSAPIDSRVGSINWVIPTGFSNASCRILIQDVNKPELWHVTNPFCVIGTAGITSIASTSGLQLYPNPANNNVNIQAEGFNGQIASIKVFSMQNPSVPVKVISMVPLVKGVLKYSVDVSALKPGHYIVEVQCNDKKQSQKFEKQ